MSLLQSLLQSIRDKQQEIIELEDEFYWERQTQMECELKVEREVLTSPDLKNENQRKFRRMELKTEDWYTEKAHSIQGKERSLKEAKADLELLQNELKLLLK